MKIQKIIPAIATLALLFPLLAAAESAKAGKFGIGGNTTLGGVNGLQIRTFVSPMLGLHGTFGFEFQAREGTGAVPADPENIFTFRIGLGGDYVLAQAANTVISAGLEGNLFQDTNAVILGLPLTGEYFLSQYFSVHAQTGLTLDIVNPETEPIDDTFGMDLFSDLWGGAGFTVWFN